MSNDRAASKPNYIYKVVPSSSSAPLCSADLPERLPISNLDKGSGFVHLSTSVQILGTLQAFFKDEKSVFILRLPYDKLENEVRWEDPKAEVCGPRPGEGLFPHLYNNLRLGKNEIDQVELLEQSDTGWDEPVEKAQGVWLLW